MRQRNTAVRRRSCEKKALELFENLRAFFQLVEQRSLSRIAKDTGYRQSKAEARSQKRTDLTVSWPSGSRSASLAATNIASAASCTSPANPSLPACANAFNFVRGFVQALLFLISPKDQSAQKGYLGSILISSERGGRALASSSPPLGR